VCTPVVAVVHVQSQLEVQRAVALTSAGQNELGVRGAVTVGLGDRCRRQRRLTCGDRVNRLRARTIMCEAGATWRMLLAHSLTQGLSPMVLDRHVRHAQRQWSPLDQRAAAHRNPIGPHPRCELPHHRCAPRRNATRGRARARAAEQNSSGASSVYSSRPGWTIKHATWCRRMTRSRPVTTCPAQQRLSSSSGQFRYALRSARPLLRSGRLPIQ
jgi:hypothetical protein